MKALYVCPTGNDDNEGSEASPFESLHKALEAVVSLPSPIDGESDEAGIILKDGIHRLNETLHITRKACCDGKRAITIEAQNPGGATLSDHNLYFCTGDPALSESFIDELRRESIDTFSLGVDPCFVDAKNGDFNLKSDSPLSGIGFQPLPLEKMLSVGKDLEAQT